MKTLNAFGDSITCGTGASTPTNDYVSLICTAMSYTQNNQGDSGHELADFFPQIYGTSITDTSVSLILPGFNDMRHWGADATALQSFTNELYSALAWLAIPQESKIIAQSSAVTYTGTWNNTTVYGGALGKNSNTPGSTASFCVYGSVVYIDIIQFQGFNMGVQVDINGVNMGTFSNSSFTSTNAGIGYSPYLLRFAGLSSQLHNVVLTIVSGTGYAYFNWAAGNEGIYNQSAPIVYTGNTLRCNPTGYAEGSPLWSNGSLNASYSYSYIIETLAIILGVDGLRVKYANTDSKYNLNTDVCGDNLHPNDSGHSHIAQAFLYSMS